MARLSRFASPMNMEKPLSGNSVPPEDSPSDVAVYLIRSAVLAPSSHNTQPWRFRMAGRGVDLMADPTRALPVNDPQGRELRISCGCALMNLRVAAAARGLPLRVRPLPDDADPDCLASIQWSDTPVGVEQPLAGLFPALPQRRTTRKPFAEDLLPDTFQQDLEEAASKEDAVVQFMGKRELREKLAGLVAEGDTAQWSNPAWRHELASWMLPASARQGLTVPAPVAPLMRFFVRRFNFGRAVGNGDASLAIRAPSLAVLATEQDTPDAWLRAGQGLQRVLLEACLKGVQAGYLNQPVQVEELRPRLRALLGEDLYPQLLIRFGRPRSGLPPSPRRPAEDVIQPPP